MLKYLRKIRQNLIIGNRTERLKTVQRTVLVMEPACRVGK